jgi:hypothetical protein
MNKKENGLPRAIKALAMTNKGTFSYPTKNREEGLFWGVPFWNTPP